MLNHLARVLAVTMVRQGGKVKCTIASLTEGQCRRAQCGVGGGNLMAGGCNVTTIGTWSHPMEGREVSSEDQKGERAELEKARFQTEGLEIVSKWKRV